MQVGVPWENQANSREADERMQRRKTEKRGEGRQAFNCHLIYVRYASAQRKDAKKRSTVVVYEKSPGGLFYRASWEGTIKYQAWEEHRSGEKRQN